MHGFSTPVAGRFRNSVALYYYMAEAPPRYSGDYATHGGRKPGGGDARPRRLQPFRCPCCSRSGSWADSPGDSRRRPTTSKRGRPPRLVRAAVRKIAEASPPFQELTMRAILMMGAPYPHWRLWPSWPGRTARTASLPNVHPAPIGKDKSVKYDYDIVYVRAPRKGDDKQHRLDRDRQPAAVEPGADLMLLHPDGSEEVLVAGGDEPITDPFVSFDGEWVYYAHFHDVKRAGAGRPVSARRTSTRSTSRRGRSSADAAGSSRRTPGRRLVEDYRRRSRQDPAYGVFNLGPVPAARRQGDVHQQPQRLRSRPRATRRPRCNCSSWTTTAATSR